jgi:hypothetical protein
MDILCAVTASSAECAKATCWCSDIRAAAQFVSARLGGSKGLIWAAGEFASKRAAASLGGSDFTVSLASFGHAMRVWGVSGL